MDRNPASRGIEREAFASDHVSFVEEGHRERNARQRGADLEHRLRQYASMDLDPGLAQPCHRIDVPALEAHGQRTVHQGADAGRVVEARGGDGELIGEPQHLLGIIGELGTL